MNSLTRPLTRTARLSSPHLRRSLPSIYATSTDSITTYDAAMSCTTAMDQQQQRFLQTTTNATNLKATSAASTLRFSNQSLALLPYYRSFHGTSRQLEEAVAATEEDTSSSDEEPHPTEIDYDFTPPPPLSEESISKINGLFEQILHLDMVEVHLLTMVVNEQLGIKWNQVQGAGAGPIGGGAGAAAPAEEEVEEKLLMDLKLVGFDAKAKIKVIKEVRSIAGLGLKEAKEMVEGAPKIIQKELKPEKAEELKAQLEAVGAQIEIC